MCSVSDCTNDSTYATTLGWRMRDIISTSLRISRRCASENPARGTTLYANEWSSASRRTR